MIATSGFFLVVMLARYLLIVSSLAPGETFEHDQVVRKSPPFLSDSTIYPSLSNFSKNAYWIWAPASMEDDDDKSFHSSRQSPANNTWMLFRRTLSLPWDMEKDNGSSLQLHAKIAVDSKYWLWASWHHPCIASNTTTSSPNDSLLFDQYSLMNDDGDGGVNGTTVGAGTTLLLVREGGLKRGPTPHDTWYDPLSLDIPYYNPPSNCRPIDHTVSSLKNGAIMTIQILVWYFGTDGFSHKDSGQGGLILDGTVTRRMGQKESNATTSSTREEAIPLVSDDKWIVKPHPAFRRQEHAGDDGLYDKPNYRLSEHNIYYDTRYDSKRRPTSNTWKNAVPLGRAGSKPWNRLWPRMIPQWKDSGLKDYQDVQVQHLSTSKNNDTHVIIVRAKLPYNTQFYPWIQITGMASNCNDPESDHRATPTITTIQVDIQTDNYQYHKPRDHKSGDPTYLRARYITTPNSCDDDDDGTTLLSPTVTNTFESPSWINGHVVTYRIQYSYNTSATTTTLPVLPPTPRVKYRETQYDTELTGSFHSSDDFLNTLWHKAQRTLLVNMRDNFMDCPDRERAQWWGDVTIQLGQVMYAMGSGNNSDGTSTNIITDWKSGADQTNTQHSAHALIRKAISDLVNWQQPDKGHHPSGCHKLHAPVPEGNYPRELPLQMLASIGWYGIHTYYLYTGDNETVEMAYPHIRAYLRTCWSMNTTTGLVNHRHGDWDWKDWGENFDGPILDNAWYVLALRATIGMAQEAGHWRDVAHWTAQLTSIRQNVDAAFWTGEWYQSSKSREAKLPPDDRSNALVVLAGLVPPERFPKVVKVLTTQRWASPYMEKYVLESLFVMRHADEALERMKDRYHDMVTAPNITTLWEAWDLSGGSYNHAWSGGPLTLLSQYSVGIAPTSPGWRTFHLLPQEGRDITHVRASVPVFISGNHDIITVSIRKVEEDNGQRCIYEMDLSSPSNTVATVGLPREVNIKEKTCQLRAVKVEALTLWTIGEEKELQIEPSNIEGLLFKGETEAYILWEVNSGRWHFKGIADCKSHQDGLMHKEEPAYVEW